MMYIQAEYFQIEGPKKAAKENVSKTFMDRAGRESIAAIVEEIFNSTPPHDLALRIRSSC
jgi:hypothetical protein